MNLLSYCLKDDISLIITGTCEFNWGWQLRLTLADWLTTGNRLVPSIQWLSSAQAGLVVVLPPPLFFRPTCEAWEAQQEWFLLLSCVPGSLSQDACWRLQRPSRILKRSNGLNSHRSFWTVKFEAHYTCGTKLSNMVASWMKWEVLKKKKYCSGAYEPTKCIGPLCGRHWQRQQ